MNKQILQKCITELQKDKPDLSYLRGILETLVDSSPIAESTQSQWTYTGAIPATVMTTSNQIELSDEETEQQDLANRYTKGPVAELQ